MNSGRFPRKNCRNAERMDPMNDIPQLLDLAIALGIGVMIGVERGWSQREMPEGTRVAGLRTFSLFGLFGGISAVMGTVYGEVILGALAVGAASIVVVSLLAGRRDPDNRDITTEVALLLTFALGVLAGFGRHQEAVACGVVVTVLLGLKPSLHGWLKTLERKEMTAAFRLLVMSLVILPVLPDRGFGPWNALNPYTIWLMVVLISAMTFGGYLAVKWAGPRLGLLVTGFLGGMTSSTAVSVAMARLSKGGPALEPISAAAALAGSTVMYLRVLALCAVFGPVLAWRLAAPLCAMAVASLLVLAAIWPRGAFDVEQSTTDMIEPFDLKMPLRFAAVLAVVMVVSAAVRDWVGDSGLLAVSALAGLTDVDAPSLTAAQMVTGGLSPSVGVLAVLLAVGVNVFAKLGIVLWIGSRRMALRVGAGFLASLAAGTAAWWLAG
jgi:uncharacterized membrane protein (DUF4010 family)